MNKRGLVSLRCGFTLLEVLIAVSLTTFLMAAMYSAMDIYYQGATDSYAEIERSQLARAILADISTDIKSVTFAESEEIDDEEEDSLTEADQSTYTTGLYGTATDLTLFLSRPNRDGLYVNSDIIADASDRTSDAVLVRYFLVDPGASELAEALASQENDPDFEESVLGLGRLVGDMADMSYAISNNDTERQLDGSTLMAKEVADISFEYFDGLENQVEWDSTEANQMPQAIVVKLTLRTLVSTSDDRPPEDQPGWIPETIHTMVVPIPVADPFAGLIPE